MKNKDFTYILYHFGEEEEPFGAVSPPIFQTSNFSFETFKDFQDAVMHEDERYLYTRGNNPTVRIAEKKLAALERGEDARLFASGVSAIAAAVMAFVSSGDHIVSVKDTYGWAKTLFDEYLARFGVDVTYVEGAKVEEFEKVIKPNTKIIYLESPTTFTFKIQDLEGVGKLGKNYGIKTMIDNSWATPYFQNPIDFGIDLVIHSTSKYLSGHMDIMGGVVIGKKEDIRHIFETEALNIGGTPDPFAAWLLLRGLRTLHIRMDRHFKSAMKIATYLYEHPKVDKVLYPFLPTHPQYELAKKQMQGGSSPFSVKLKTYDREEVGKFVDRLKYFKKAVSWGGYVSFVEPYIALHPDAEKDLVPLVRFYIGLEGVELLISDLDEALSVI